MLDSIPTYVGERLGYYVYLYVDPRTNEPFYVGKGQGARAEAHLRDTSESLKVARIKEIRAAGLKPQIDILVHGLVSEEAAFRIEAAVIDAIGPNRLTNAVRGWESGKVGRMPLSELVAHYGATPVEVVYPSLLIRINRLYRYGMEQTELYEVTRGTWKLGSKRTRARYAFSVFHGVVREVFEIESWHAERTTPYTIRVFDDPTPQPGRWEFIGKPAEESIRKKYVGCSVQSYFKQGLQSPVVYVNCDGMPTKTPTMSASISTLFSPEPSQWGLRGDPYLWREMATHFQSIPLPGSLPLLSSALEEAFLKLTNHAVSFSGDVHLARHAHGGMSSGEISTEFWRESGIPLLLSRFNA